MGTKFGHISIFNSDIQEAKSLLKSSAKRLLTVDEIVNIMVKQCPPSSPEAWETIDKIRALKGEQAERLQQQFIPNRGEYFIRENNALITIFSEEYSFGVVESSAITYSQNSTKTFLATSIFDGDLFVLILARNGTSIARHVWGQTEPYMEQTLGEASIFAEAFGIPDKKSQINEAFQNNDIEEQVATLRSYSMLSYGWLYGPKALAIC
jgi:hypothetical protein